ncbi:hypothetical protein QJQ45_026348 [Haematococcus lacustris]|nr:hypothetical protein QJQ45_026348 [Haematococcus lacustris]
MAWGPFFPLGRGSQASHPGVWGGHCVCSLLLLLLLVDSGCSRHLTPHRELLHDYQPLHEPHHIIVANGGWIEAKGQGAWHQQQSCGNPATSTRDELLHDDQLLQPPHQILCANNNVMAAQRHGTGRFKTEDGKLQLQHVLHVPGASSSLLSLGRAVRAGITPRFSKTGCELTATHRAPLTSRLQGGSLCHRPAAHSNARQPWQPVHGCTNGTVTRLLWHFRFAHSSCRRLANMVRHNMVLGIDVSAAEFEQHANNSTLCELCIMGKQHMWLEPQHAGLNRPAQQVHELVHSDVCGPMEVAALDGNMYYVSLLVDLNKRLAVTLIKQKLDAAAAIIDMVTALERQTGSQLKALRSDRGGEYTGAELQRWMRTQGVVHRLTAPYNPEMSGSADRINSTVPNMVRAMMDAVAAPKPLWGEAAKAAAMIHNVTSVAGQPNTPWEMVFKVKSDVTHLRVWGAPAYTTSQISCAVS